MQHRVIKGAKKTSYLTELIERFERWQAENGDEDSGSSESDEKKAGAGEDPNWEFGTVKAPSGSKVAPAAGNFGKYEIWFQI